MRHAQVVLFAGIDRQIEAVGEAANTADVEPQILFIYGYPRARKEEIAFIDRIAADGSIYYLPIVEGSDVFAANSIYADQMSGWDWTIDKSVEPPHTSGERVAARCFDRDQEIPAGVAAYALHDVSSEVRFVLGEVKKLLRK